jgi:hypothetical protein
MKHKASHALHPHPIDRRKCKGDNQSDKPGASPTHAWKRCETSRSLSSSTETAENIKLSKIVDATDL